MTLAVGAFRKFMALLWFTACWVTSLLLTSPKRKSCLAPPTAARAETQPVCMASVLHAAHPARPLQERSI